MLCLISLKVEAISSTARVLKWVWLQRRDMQLRELEAGKCPKCCSWMPNVLLTKRLCSNCTVPQKQAQVLISKTLLSMTTTLKLVRLVTNNWNTKNMLFVKVYFSPSWFWKLLYCKRQGDICCTSLPDFVNVRYAIQTPSALVMLEIKVSIEPLS